MGTHVGSYRFLAERLDDEEAAMVNAAPAHSVALLKVKRRQRR